MITIKDMAEIAGVSPTTVANVLHGRTKKMSKETLKKVQDVIDQSHYVSNMGARVLANYGSRIIGVIMNYDRRAENNAMADPFYGTIVGAWKKKSGNTVTIWSYIWQGVLKKRSGWHLPGILKDWWLLGCRAEDVQKMKEQLKIAGGVY